MSKGLSEINPQIIQAQQKWGSYLKHLHHPLCFNGNNAFLLSGILRMMEGKSGRGHYGEHQVLILLFYHRDSISSL